MLKEPIPQAQTAPRLRVQAWHTLPAARVMEALGTGTKGLDFEEAARRLAEFGPNHLRIQPPPPYWLLFLRQFKSPILVVLFGAAVVSFLLGERVDAAVILGIMGLNAMIGFVQESRAQQALEALSKLTSPRATVLRAGEELDLPAAEVVPGDLLLLAAGDRVAADARLLHASDLELDEAVLTGESVPALKLSAPLGDPDLPMADRRNMVFMNTVVTRGRGLAVLVATGMATEMGRIAGSLESPTEDPLRRQMRRLSHKLGLVVLFLVLGTMALGAFRGYAFLAIFHYALGMAVSAIPEGLPLVVTILLAVGVWRMARQNALIRNLPAIEALGAISAICTDKTGTLTRNMMTVRRVELVGRRYAVTGEGYRPVGAFEPEQDGAASDDTGLRPLLDAAWYCNDAALHERDGHWEIRGDPTEGALLTLAHKAGPPGEGERIAEISFTSERRWMATLNQMPDGRVLAYAKGALERMLPMSEGWLDRDGQVLPLDEELRAALTERAEAMAAQALRVLAFAYLPDVDLSRDFAPPCLEGRLIFLGFVGMNDPPREEATAAIDVCRSAGIRVAMITGDQRGTAEAIAREMGILRDGGQVMTGSELQALDDAAFEARVADVAIYARVEPEHKLRIVRMLQAGGHIVAMTGDGVNDAPALSRADVGIAMGRTGTEVAKEASDMVLADDNFATIVAAVAEGRRIGENLRKVLRYLFATSTGEAMTFSTAIALGMPLPLLPLQILWLNLITDGSFDKSLAMEPADPDLMDRPPRPPHASLLAWDVVGPVLAVAPLMMAGTFLVFSWTLSQGESLEKAQTMAFSTLALFQWFSAFSLRSLDTPIFCLQPNRWMFLSLGISMVLHLGVIYAPFLQRAFRTVPLAPSELLATLGVASSLFVVLEGRKIWLSARRCRPRRAD